MVKVKKPMEDLEHKRGFNHMDQAFTMVETMYLLAGRKRDMNAVSTLTDVKPHSSSTLT